MSKPIVSLNLSAFDVSSDVLSLSGYSVVSVPYEKDILIIASLSGVFDGEVNTIELYIPAGETQSASVSSYNETYSYVSSGINLYSEFNVANVIVDSVQVYEFPEPGLTEVSSILASDLRINNVGMYSNPNTPVQLYITPFEGPNNNVHYSGVIFRNPGFTTELLSIVTLSNPQAPTYSMFELWVPQGADVSATVANYVSPVTLDSGIPWSSYESIKDTEIVTAVFLEYDGPEDEIGYQCTVDCAVVVDANIIGIVDGVPQVVPTATPTATPAATPAASLPATPAATPAVTPTPSASSPAQVVADDPVPVNNRISLKDLLGNATYLQGSQVVTNTGTASEQVFVYAIYNTEGQDIYATVEFLDNFNGVVDIYNGLEFAKCKFVIDGSYATYDSVNYYNITEDYYDNNYIAPDLSFPAIADVLGTVNVIQGSEKATFKIRVNTDGIAYIVITANPSTFKLTSNYIVLQPISPPAPPSEPATTEPALGESIDVSGSGVFELKLSQESTSSIDNKDVNLAVNCKTDKVVQVTIEYGPFKTQSGYMYDSQQDINTDELLEELRHYTQDPTAVLTPLSITNGAGYNTQALSMDIVGSADESPKITINAPIPSTRFSITLDTGAAIGVPKRYDDTEAFRALPDEDGESVWARMRHLGYF